MSHHTATATTTAGEDSHRAVLHQGRTSIDALGPPLQPGNWANLTESCTLNPKEFKRLARPGPVRVASCARQNLQRASLYHSTCKGQLWQDRSRSAGLGSVLLSICCSKQSARW